MERTATEREIQDLKGLVRFGRALGEVRTLQELERKMAEFLFGHTVAKRVAFWVSPELPPGNALLAAWDRKTGPGAVVEINRELADWATQDGMARAGQNISVEGKVAPRTVLGKARSVAAVPLTGYSQTNGLVYLEAQSAEAHFDESSLELLNAVGLLGGIILEHAQRLELIEGANRPVRRSAEIEHNLVGKSRPMLEVIDFIGRAAPKDSTVLISGESGTGKELVARAIHANSGRSKKPFIAINCAALTDTLLESELFGHEKGSFTGAIVQKKGKLEVAEGGTVFLDEVGEMSPILQAKVLRVLQEREFERVGGTKSHQLDIRLIAATNRDLRQEALNGGFRQDLFFRLNVVSITMPSLRSRREDIPVLAEFFAAKYGTKLGRPVLGVSRDTRALLMSYDWPGNVRELENVIERAVVLGTASSIVPEDLPAIVREQRPEEQIGMGLAEGVREAKRQLIRRALDRTSGNHAKAAELLGVHANHLSRLITTLHLRED